MSSLRMRALAIYLRVSRKPGQATAARTRQAMNAPKVRAEPPRRLLQRYDVRLSEIDGYKFWTVDSGRTCESTVIYLHGGAYISGPSPQHWKLIEHIADAGHRVEVPLYGLAPQHTVDEAIPFVVGIYERLVMDRPDARIVIAGDSAGGGLALAASQVIRDAGLPAPALLALIAPWTDITLSNPAIEGVDDPWLSADGLREAGRAWAGANDPRDPKCSPLLGTFHQLPPIEVFIGTRDLFHPDALVLAASCRAAGSLCNVHQVEGAVHVYPLVPAPEGKRGRREFVEALG
jgi:epsilon-lactone hydrolase